jgi:hypothetical protein
MYSYTVACTFEDEATALAWVLWLTEEHLADVLSAGARSAEVLRMDGQTMRYEVRYAFASRADFQAYEQDHAARLRAEGLARFPLERGLRYERSTGEVVARRVATGPRIADDTADTQEPAP